VLLCTFLAFDRHDEIKKEKEGKKRKELQKVKAIITTRRKKIKERITKESVVSLTQWTFYHAFT